MANYPELKFKNYGNEGFFEWGKERLGLWERFYDIEEIEDIEVYIAELQEIIKEDPEFLDAYNSLGWLEIELKNYGNALLFFDSAYKIAQKCIPKNFKGQISWGIIENRPFLHTLYGLCIAHLFTKSWKKASLISEKILKYNPNDDQGIRALAIHSYIAQGEFKKILKICRKYPQDTLPDVLYGKVLAYYRLDEMEKAKKALKDAIEISPNVGKELIKSKHKAFSGENFFAFFGEEGEAFDYWERLGEYWTDLRLKKMIKEMLEKNTGKPL